VGSSLQVIEGLAYQHHSFLAPSLTKKIDFAQFGKGTENILDVIIK